MNRDMDLIRKILFKLEASDSYMPHLNFSVDGYDLDFVRYNLALLRDSGLVVFHNPMGHPEAIPSSPTRLTWEGHEFLESIRSDSAWAEVKDKMASVGGFVYEVAKALAIDYMRRELGL